MTPAEFAEVVVVPTLCEFLADRGDRRRAYLACIVVYHLVDHVAHAEALKKTDAVWSGVKAVAGLSFVAVNGICNGTKHPQSNHARRFPPGAETDWPSCGYGEGDYSMSRYGGMAGLEVEVEGYCLFIDMCVQAVFRAFITTYPQHLGSVDRSFLDEQFQGPAPPLRLRKA